ncbi:hypothetical protein HH212_09125 [Massilia forsythiae]|uniref:Uncharacterized protein n=1 Tax=Massilia forsythiae TaxID=2728020 RepID=A0A7Z2VVE1_9BURK|nr:hypothetical protein [Massilia forsythiae]QJE00166.1 hypothetical protein HH212_09125 [Massilia forsythiae]
MTNAVGPLFAGGFQAIKAGQYELLFLPDLHNDELQREGKPPVYYWMPGAVRLSRANVDTGPREFHLTHFLGVQSADTTVGATGTREVAGGLITFTTTAAPPAAELEAAQNALADMFKGKDDHFWGWRTPVAPAFRPMPVMERGARRIRLRGQAPAARPTRRPRDRRPRRTLLAPCRPSVSRPTRRTKR